MDTLRIRPARPEDAAAISALIDSLAHSLALSPEVEGAGRFLDNITAESISDDIVAENILYLAGFVGERLAGVVAVRNGSHLTHLCVDPEYQRLGIARKLWQSAGASCIAAGNRKGFTAHAPPQALPVYEQFGFRTTGPRIEKNGIAFIPMRMTLSQDCRE